MRRKIPSTKAKYKAGQVVNVAMIAEPLIIQGIPGWNGFTWMYSFENQDLRCGEDYLKPLA